MGAKMNLVRWAVGVTIVAGAFLAGSAAAQPAVQDRLGMPWRSVTRSGVGPGVADRGTVLGMHAMRDQGLDDAVSLGLMTRAQADQMKSHHTQFAGQGGLSGTGLMPGMTTIHTMPGATGPGDGGMTPNMMPGGMASEADGMSPWMMSSMGATDGSLACQGVDEASR